MASTTPEGLEIRPRHLDFDLPDPMPRHWHSGDAFKTHMFNAMSVLFPDGERFFIDSVRHYRERVEDPALKQQIRGFIGQEGHHSREHLVYSAPSATTSTAWKAAPNGASASPSRNCTRRGNWRPPRPWSTSPRSWPTAC